MRDAMAPAAAVFEPEEVAILAVATRLASRKLEIRLNAGTQSEADIAKLVHNLGRSRIRLRKPMQTEAHAAEIADEAIELFTYLEEAPAAVSAAIREGASLPTSAERIVGAFPNAFRQPPVNRL